MTYQELITNALVLCGRLAEGAIPDGQTAKTAVSKLNNVFGSAELKSMGTWNEVLHKFCLSPGKPSYTVGTGQDIDINRSLSIVELRTKIINGAVFYKGQASIATVLALTTATNGDYYEITDSNGTIEIGDYVVLNKDITVLITSSDYDVVTDQGSYSFPQEYKYDDFIQLPNTQGQGTPVIFHYRPGTTSGTLYLWRTGNAGQQITFTSFEGWQDITSDDLTSDVNFPEGWKMAIEYKLAVECGMVYGTPVEKLDRLKSVANVELDNASGSNITEGGTTFYASTTH